MGKKVQDFLPEGVSGIPTEVRIKVTLLSQLTGTTPTDYYCSGGLGETEIVFSFTAVLNDGELLESPLPQYTRESTQAHSSTIAKPGVSLGEAWGEKLGEIKYIVEYHRDFCEWEGGSSNCDEEYIVLYIVREDGKERISKIRRRIEDALRKCDDPMVILRLGAMLGVKFE
ncbi:MAG: hypothetical protein PHP21_00520 [Patescibacteria group bacterium]|nr:hypothetical protein [Patescibacteria group bacterium]